MTKYFKSKLAKNVLAAFLAASMGSAALAEDFPNKPINMIVTSEAGAPSDFVARVLTERVGPKLGQPVLIENLSGAGGILGAQKLAKAVPDGYTIGQFNSGLPTILPYMMKDLAFDPLKDFKPIAVAGLPTSILVVRSDLGVKTLPEFIEMVKKNPNKVTYASVGAGSTQHLLQAGLNNMAGIEMKHIPYKGAAQAMTAVISGEVDAYWLASQPALGPIKEGQLIPLAVHTAERLPILPDVPTVKESTSLPFEMGAWWAIFVPRDTPENVMTILRTKFNEVIADPAVMENFQSRGIGVRVIEDPAAFQAEIEREAQRNKELITSLGLLVQ